MERPSRSTNSDNRFWRPPLLPLLDGNYDIFSTEQDDILLQRDTWCNPVQNPFEDSVDNQSKIKFLPFHQVNKIIIEKYFLAQSKLFEYMTTGKEIFIVLWHLRVRLKVGSWKMISCWGRGGERDSEWVNKWLTAICHMSMIFGMELKLLFSMRSLIFTRYDFSLNVIQGAWHCTHTYKHTHTQTQNRQNTLIHNTQTLLSHMLS